jgi:hypothetical protein
LSEKSGATSEYDCVIRSEYSNVVSVKKLSAPDVSYTDGDTRVTSTASGNIGYYYTDSNGNEQVLTDGLVSNLPKGTFTVYAKSLPVLDNEIMSDATPEKQRVTVSNLNMTVTINKSSATSSTVNVVFSGCKDVESFSYTYEIVYYDASGNVVGRVVYSQTQTKNNTGNSDKVSFGLSFAQKGKIVYETGKTKDDAVSAELIVHITDSNNQQTQTLTSNRIDYILSDYIKD